MTKIKEFMCEICNMKFMRNVRIQRFCSRKCFGEKMKQFWASDENRKMAMIESVKMTIKDQYKNGRIPWQKGLTKETDKKTRLRLEKASETKKRLYKEGKLTSWNKGLNKYTDERLRLTGKKISKAQKEMGHHINIWKSQQRRDETSARVREMWQNVEFRAKNIKRMKDLWKDPNYRERTTRNQLNGLFKRPTSLEQLFIGLCKKYNLSYDYIGNGKVIINGANPDFINNNGQKLIIETANRFHHKDSYPKVRRAIFGKYGFKTLVLWEDDFYINRKLRLDWEENILNRVKEFENGVDFSW